MRLALLSFLFVWLTAAASAQSDSLLPVLSRVSAADSLLCGAIRNAETGEPVPFATIGFAGSGDGAVADSNGRFCLTIPTASVADSLRISAYGYRTRAMLPPPPGGDSVTLVIQPAQHEIGEVVVHAGQLEDPALVLLRKIIARKSANDPDLLDNYRCGLYTKLELDLTHLSQEQFQHLPLMRPYGFIYQNLDTVSDAVPFLPAYFTESVSDYYYGRHPRKSRERIRAVQTRGINHPGTTKMLGGMYGTLNAYADFITVLDKRVPSPIAEGGTFFYNYSLGDTVEAWGRPCYQLRFEPRRRGEAAFSGYLWVVDSLFALERIVLHVPREANINYVTRASVYQEFAPVLAGGRFFPVKDSFTAEFTGPYRLKIPGFIGRKTTLYTAPVANDAATEAVLRDRHWPIDGILLEETAHERPDSFWTAARPKPLSRNEAAIYYMVDTLLQSPAYLRRRTWLRLAMQGVVEVGKFQVGTLWNVYNGNPVEGGRIRLDVRTTPRLWKRLYAHASFGIGTLDKEVKYNARLIWLPRRTPRTTLSLWAMHDIDWTSNGYYEEGGLANNIFTTAFRRKDAPWKIVFLNEYRGAVFREFSNGLSGTLGAAYRSFDPYDPLPAAGIFYNGEGASVDQMVSTEVAASVRFAYREKFLEGYVQRTSLGSQYPVLELRGAVGFKSPLGGQYDYRKLRFSLYDKVRVAPLGTVYYNVFAGKYWSGGPLPYPLLELHPGNDFHVYNARTFNMLRRYEAVSDQYAGVFFEHTIGGGIFNYIPLVKEAKLRQFWTAKGLIGSLSGANKALNFGKDYPFKSLEGRPYLELGTGVENILQVARVDFIWRVAPQPLPGEKKEESFGIFGSLKFSF